jgi:hypothetical protein
MTEETLRKIIREEFMKVIITSKERTTSISPNGINKIPINDSVLASKFDSAGEITKHYKNSLHKKNCAHCGKSFEDTIGKVGFNLFPIKYCGQQCNADASNVRLALRRRQGKFGETVIPETHKYLKTKNK